MGNNGFRIKHCFKRSSNSRCIHQFYKKIEDDSLVDVTIGNYFTCGKNKVIEFDLERKITSIIEPTHDYIRSIAKIENLFALGPETGVIEIYEAKQ